eukprot:3566986-Pyramimonas_sp.AAC.1
MRYKSVRQLHGWRATRFQHGARAFSTSCTTWRMLAPLHDTQWHRVTHCSGPAAYIMEHDIAQLRIACRVVAARS